MKQSCIRSAVLAIILLPHTILSVNVAYKICPGLTCYWAPDMCWDTRRQEVIPGSLRLETDSPEWTAFTGKCGHHEYALSIVIVYGHVAMLARPVEKIAAKVDGCRTLGYHAMWLGASENLKPGPELLALKDEGEFDEVLVGNTIFMGTFPLSKLARIFTQYSQSFSGAYTMNTNDCATLAENVVAKLGFNDDEIDTSTRLIAYRIVKTTTLKIFLRMAAYDGYIKGTLAFAAEYLSGNFLSDEEIADILVKKRQAAKAAKAAAAETGLTRDGQPFREDNYNIMGNFVAWITLLIMVVVLLDIVRPRRRFTPRLCKARRWHHCHRRYENHDIDDYHYLLHEY